MKILNNILLYIRVYLSRRWDSFIYAQYINIFTIYGKVSIFRIDLRFPEVHFDSDKICKIFDESTKTGLKFPTEIFLERYKTYWFFNLLILGFGFSIKEYSNVK